MSMSEKDFQGWMNDLIEVTGWHKVFEDLPLLRCHKCGEYNRQARKRGHPDLEIVRDGVLVYAELKSEKGRIRPEQQETIDALQQVKFVYADIFRPSDRDELESLLKRGHMTK